ncbi:MAG: DUF262 domain-containing protein [Paludibacteraceae bacterium]|nr:DUF262 domain-containing protein [Paludibacteraceae bacterium]
MNKIQQTYIKPSNPTYTELFEKELGEYTLVVPPYQRPYVWTPQKVETLLNDWKEYLLSVQYENGIDYYMGTIIIHKDVENRKLNIVDGQQRLTTLLIIDYILNGESSAMIRYQNKIEIKVNNHKSKKNIHTILAMATKGCKDGGRYEPLRQKSIFQHIRFTVIMTENEDDAFTFFDSQNNRGVQPSAVDVLKAVHLRAIHADEDLQKKSACLWEKTQNVSENIFRNSSEKYLNDLIVTAIWRLRAWKGNSFFYEASYDDVMHEFAEKLDYTGRNNIIVYSVPSTYELLVDSNMVAKANIISNINTTKAYPFTIRQPLLKGICFFAFIETYHRIATDLFLNDTKNSEILKMRKFFNTLYIETKSTTYMSDYFIMLMIFYYDKFGSKKLYHFALCVDYIIGQWRMDNYFFRKEAMMNITKKNNIIDKIQICYEPKDIIGDLLDVQIERKHEENPDNSPVKKYVKANYDYFKQKESETDDFVSCKKEWIKNIIKNGE